jgi:putative FmdB family regulatory protein
MPTYQYTCKLCGTELEELQSITDDPLTRCPACGEDALARVLGQGSGLIFKGSGFYLTDYKKSTSPKKDEGKSGAKEETKKPASEGKKE